jgi:FkbM family methyltransferase
MPRPVSTANLPPATSRFRLNEFDLGFTHLLSAQRDFGQFVAELQRDEYGLTKIPFQPGDIVLDIGANIGFVSICLAKLFPFIKILAYEPVPINYELLVCNLVNNAVSNVVPFPLALTKDGRRIAIECNPASTIGSTANLRELHGHPDLLRFNVNSVSLDQILEDHAISACRFLKMDCEGSEYEVLLNCRWLGRVEYLSMEVHVNKLLREQGYSPELLSEYCRRHIAGDKLRMQVVKLAE